MIKVGKGLERQLTCSFKKGKKDDDEGKPRQYAYNNCHCFSNVIICILCAPKKPMQLG